MFSVLSLIVAFYFLLIGIILLIRGKNKLSARIFFAVCFTTFMWQFNWAILFQIKDPMFSSAVAKLGYFFIIFLPTAFYHFVVILDKKDDELSKVYYSYGVCYIFAIFLLFSNYFISGTYHYFWGYYPKASFLHPLHVFQTFIIAVRTIYISCEGLKKHTLQIKIRTRYRILGLLIYSFATIDYLGNYGFEFYPPGIIFISISLTIISYAIIRHKLLDVSLTINKTFTYCITFSFTILMLAAANYIFSGELLSSNPVFYIFVIIAFAFGYRFYKKLNDKIENLSQRLFLKDRVKYIEAFKSFKDNLKIVFDLDRFFVLLNNFIETSLGLRLCGVYVSQSFFDSSDNNIYCPIDKHSKQANLILNNKFKKEIISKKAFFEGRCIPDHYLTAYQNQIISINNKIIIPFVKSKKVLGFILVENGKRSVNYHHFEIFDLITEKISDFVERISLVMKMITDSSPQINNKVAKLEILNVSLANQVRNPLIAINQCSAMLKEALEESVEQSGNKITLSNDNFEEVERYLNLINSKSQRGLRMISIILNNINRKQVDKTVLKK